MRPWISLKEKEILDDSADYTDELKMKKNKAMMMKKISKTVSATRYKAVELHHQWKAKAYKDMPKKENIGKFVSNHTHYSTTDPDARVSVKPEAPPTQLHGTGKCRYSHHVITQIQTDHADKKDSQCLPSLLNNTIDNLQEKACR